MSDGGAKVHDIDAIRLFRAALIKFTETASVAIADSDSEVLRKIGWLEGEQDHYWSMQVRKWTEEVNRAKDAVRAKRIFKDALGRQQSTVDEEKKLKICQRHFEEAETKLANTRRYAKQLQRDHLLFRGGVQRLSTMLSADMPNAVAMLDAVTARLQAYIAATPTLATSTAEGTPAVSTVSTDAGAMKRAADEAVPEEESKELNEGKSESTDKE